MALPRYETLAPTFIAPLPLIPKGTVIEFDGPPGPHLHPLNKEAHEAFERWYAEESDELEPGTFRKTGQKVRLREQFRAQHVAPVEPSTVRIVEAPPKEAAPSWEQSIAAISQPAATPFTPPPPLKPRTPRSDEFVPDLEAEAGVKVLSTPPPKSKVELAADLKSVPQAVSGVTPK